MSASCDDGAVVEPRPGTPFFAIQKLSTNTIYFYNGQKAVIPYIWVRLGGLAFISGYLDVHSIHTYGLFVTFQSGNFIILMNAFRVGDDRLASRLIVVMVCFVFLGGWISMFIINYYKDWKKAYLPSLAFLFVVCLSNTIIDAVPLSQFWLTVQLLVTAMGCLCHWQSKSGFFTMFHTGNMLKTSEFIWKFLFGFKIDDPSNLGDALTVFYLVFMFGTGAVFGTNRLQDKLGLFPVMVVIGIIFLTEYKDQLQQWFFPTPLQKAHRRKSATKSEDLEMHSSPMTHLAVSAESSSSSVTDGASNV
jgi:uncharacterized membrane protein YoaK (UPF0700 family)